MRSVIVYLVVLCTVGLCWLPANAVQHELTVSMNGPSLLWSSIIDNVGSPLLVGWFQTDLNNIAALNGPRTVVSTTVNVIGLSVTYTIDTPDSAAHVQQAVFAYSFPHLNEQLEMVKIAFLLDYVDIFPADFHPVVPLGLPIETTTVPPAEIVSVWSSSNVLFFSGNPQTWSAVLATRADEVEQAIATLAGQGLTQAGVIATAEVRVNVVFPSGKTTQLARNRQPGLRAQLVVSQQITVDAKHPYTVLEANSLLNSIPTAPLTALYRQEDAFAGSIEHAKGSIDTESKVLCSTACVSMIVMSSLSAFLMFVSLLMVLVCLFTSVGYHARRFPAFFSSHNTPLEKELI